MPQITIPDDMYQRLANQAAALKVTVEQLVTTSLERACDREATMEGAIGLPRTPSGDLPYHLWKARFDQLLASVEARADRYPPGFQADVSRESIYEGRGE